MTVRVYSSNDSGAPVLTNTAGALANVFKTCLVGTAGTAYGAKPSAGWTCAVDNTNDILLRNSAVDGSGAYYRIKDDGYQHNVQTTANYGLATFTGAKGYTSISELITPFPRTITGSDRHNNTYYGITLNKANSASLPSTWKIIADNRTCYFIYNHTATTNSDFTQTPSSGFKRVFGFGDLKKLGNVTNNPQAFLSGLDFTGGLQLMANAGAIVGFLEHPLTGGNQSTMYLARNAVGLSQNGARWDWYSYIHGATIPYPSPTTGGAIFEPIFIQDDTNNVVRTERHTNYELGLFAQYRGFYACNHQIGTGAGQIGAELDVVEDNGKQYQLFLLPHHWNGNVLMMSSFAFDITGDWE